MPHQLYISTLPTFTYKEYVDGHRIQCVKLEREEKESGWFVVIKTAPQKALRDACQKSAPCTGCPKINLFFNSCT